MRIRETMMWISRLYHRIRNNIPNLRFNQIPTYLWDINEVIGKSPRIPDNPSWLKISQLFTSVIPTILATSSKLVCSKLTSLNAYRRGLITVSQLRYRKQLKYRKSNNKAEGYYICGNYKGRLLTYFSFSAVHRAAFC